MLCGICRCLSRWQALLQQASAYKLAHPLTQAAARAAGSVSQSRNGLEYEQAVRFNYNDQDRSLLIDCVGAVKSLANLMLDSSALLQRSLQSHAYSFIQTFAHGLVSRQLEKAHQKRKSKAEELLLRVRQYVADWGGVVDQQAPEAYRQGLQKRAKGGNYRTYVPSTRAATPSTTQFFAMLAALEAVVHPTSACHEKGGIMRRPWFSEDKVCDPA